MAKKFDVNASDYQEAVVVAGSALVAGNIVLGTNFNGFTLVDVVSGAEYAEIRKCENVQAEKAAVAITVDDVLYWDDTAKLVTNVVGTNTLIGWAKEAAVSGATHLQMFFDGFAAYLKA